MRLTRLYFKSFELQFNISGTEDKNFINFRLRNKDVTRLVDGMEITSTVQVADGRSSLCRSNSTAGSQKMLQKAGFTFKYSEKGSKGGGVSAGFDNGMTKEEIQIAGPISQIWLLK